eukprot:6410443-Alexandrium_andersonii.AAC.1
MEDLGEGESTPTHWKSYLEACGRRKRWIDGLGLLASAEVMEARILVLAWNPIAQAWGAVVLFQPRNRRRPS